MPRLSTKGAMQRALEDLDARLKMTEGIIAGSNATLIAAMPLAKRPEDSHDLDRGYWSRDANGRPLWVRVNT